MTSPQLKAAITDRINAITMRIHLERVAQVLGVKTEGGK